MTNNFTPAKAGQQSKRLSKEEYAEKMKTEKEAVYRMADDTAKAIVADPEKFKAFLDTQSRLDRYSAVNALLIYKQLPEASQLKNFDDWSKDNVKIQKGAKSISILEPVEYAKRDGTTGISYNVKKVFDVSQTNGKRPPAPSVNRGTSVISGMSRPSRRRLIPTSTSKTSRRISRMISVRSREIGRASCRERV